MLYPEESPLYPPFAPHWTQWRSHRNPYLASRRCSSRSGSPTAGTWIVAIGDEGCSSFHIIPYQIIYSRMIFTIFIGLNWWDWQLKRFGAQSKMVCYLLFAIDLQSSCATKPRWWLQQSLHERCIACRLGRHTQSRSPIGWEKNHGLETALDSPLSAVSPAFNGLLLLIL